MRKLTVVVVAALGCSKGGDAVKAQPSNTPPATPTTDSHADRQAFIDETNRKTVLTFRVSFGDTDDALLVEFTDKTACAEDVLNKLAEPISEQAQAVGFKHLTCKPAAPAPAPPIEATAKQLYADYEANEVSADDKYKGKPLSITGVIKKISKNAFDATYIALAAGDQFGLDDVWAFCDDKSALGKLKRGEKVVMTCLGNGLIVNTPVLKNCAIEHVFVRVPSQ